MPGPPPTSTKAFVEPDVDGLEMDVEGLLLVIPVALEGDKSDATVVGLPLCGARADSSATHAEQVMTATSIHETDIHETDMP